MEGSLLLVIVVISMCVPTVIGLYIDGCPMFGCRPSGSFSFYLQIPTTNASVNWITQQTDAIPNPLGCVSDSANIVCQSNGVFQTDRGYISLNHNGSLAWRDKLLSFPPLPLIDNFGDVTGSDGVNLVHYDQTGKAYPPIPCPNMKPIYSMALVGDSDLLLVSGNGIIAVRETNGVPVGFITLNDTVDDVNGTFVPIAQPAINSNENRIYLLTRFQLQEQSDKDRTSSTSAIRLYAIDVHASISDRIIVAWNLTLDERHFSETPRHDAGPGYLTNTMQAVLFDRVNKEIYVNIKATDTRGGSLIGINDNGKVVFVNKNTNVQVMTKFVTDHCQPRRTREAATAHACLNKNGVKSLLWLLTNEQMIKGVDATGKLQKTYDLKEMLGARSLNMTSQISSVRNSDVDNDTLVFAVSVVMTDTTMIKMKIGATGKSSSLFYKSTRSSQSSFMIALDTGKDDNDKAAILWMVPVPNNAIVRGQISGAGGADVSMKDQLVAYAETQDSRGFYFTVK